MKKTPEKWRVVLWDTDTPKIGRDTELFRREYASQSSLNRAMPGLWRAYPKALLAVVSHFKFTGLFWISGEDGTTKVERPALWPDTAGTASASATAPCPRPSRTATRS